MSSERVFDTEVCPSNDNGSLHTYLVIFNKRKNLTADIQMVIRVKQASDLHVSKQNMAIDFLILMNINFFLFVIC